MWTWAGRLFEIGSTLWKLIRWYGRHSAHFWIIRSFLYSKKFNAPFRSYGPYAHVTLTVFTRYSYMMLVYNGQRLHAKAVLSLRITKVDEKNASPLAKGSTGPVSWLTWCRLYSVTSSRWNSPTIVSEMKQSHFPINADGYTWEEHVYRKKLCTSIRRFNTVNGSRVYGLQLQRGAPREKARMTFSYPEEKTVSCKDVGALV